MERNRRAPILALAILLCAGGRAAAAPLPAAVQPDTAAVMTPAVGQESAGQETVGQPDTAAVMTPAVGQESAGQETVGQPDTAAVMTPAVGQATAGQAITALAWQTAAAEQAAGRDNEPARGNETARPVELSTEQASTEQAAVSGEDTARSRETARSEHAAFTAGLLLEVPLLRAIGMANIYVPSLPVQPRLALGYGDIQILLTAAPLRLADGWEEGPYYAAFSAAVLLSPRFGLYHPQAGVEAWFSSLPRSSPEDAWEILPGDPPSDDTVFFQSYCVRAAPLRFGFDIGPVSIDISLFDFFYGPVIPLTVYPGFRIAGTSVIWVNYCSFAVTYRWEGR